jgi:hypothetical protein
MSYERFAVCFIYQYNEKVTENLPLYFHFNLQIHKIVEIRKLCIKGTPMKDWKNFLWFLYHFMKVWPSNLCANFLKIPSSRGVQNVFKSKLLVYFSYFQHIYNYTYRYAILYNYAVLKESIFQGLYIIL